MLSYADLYVVCFSFGFSVSISYLFHLVLSLKVAQTPDKC